MIGSRRRVGPDRWAQLLSVPGLKIDWHITKMDISRAGDMAYTLYKYEMTVSGPEMLALTILLSGLSAASRQIQSGQKVSSGNHSHALEVWRILIRRWTALRFPRDVEGPPT
jgi:hypothetical protein